MAKDEDIQIESVNMAQTMVVAASMVCGIIPTFYKESDDEKQKITISYVALSIFLYQLCSAAKHKEKMIGILEAVIASIKDGANYNPPRVDEETLAKES